MGQRLSGLVRATITMVFFVLFNSRRHNQWPSFRESGRLSGKSFKKFFVLLILTTSFQEVMHEHPIVLQLDFYFDFVSIWLSSFLI